MQAELVLDCRNSHGEGVFWNPADRQVWWTDIEGRALWSFDPETGRGTDYPMPDRVCCFAPRIGGGLLIAFANRISLFDLQSGKESLIARFEDDQADTRLNDGRTDRSGRFVAGGMNEGTGKPTSSVISVDPDLSIRTLIDGVSCANSTCFSPDGRMMFFADTPDREVVAYDYDPATGDVTNRRVHASFKTEPGLPDGSCVDAEGGVWNAEWEGRRVVRIAPNGTIDQIIDVPVWKPTCCAFGGPNLDTLYITTSRLMSDEEMLGKEPESGGLFAAVPGVCGVEDTPFHG